MCSYLSIAQYSVKFDHVLFESMATTEMMRIDTFFNIPWLAKIKLMDSNIVDKTRILEHNYWIIRFRATTRTVVRMLSLQ